MKKNTIVVKLIIDQCTECPSMGWRLGDFYCSINGKVISDSKYWIPDWCPKVETMKP